MERQKTELKRSYYCEAAEGRQNEDNSPSSERPRPADEKGGGVGGGGGGGAASLPVEARVPKLFTGQALSKPKGRVRRTFRNPLKPGKVAKLAWQQEEK